MNIDSKQEWKRTFNFPHKDFVPRLQYLTLHSHSTKSSVLFLTDTFWRTFQFPKNPVTLSLQNLQLCHKKQTQQQIIAFFPKLQLYNQGKYIVISFTLVTTVAQPYYRRFRWFDSIDIELLCSISIQVDLRLHGCFDRGIIVLPTYSKIEFGRYWAFLLNMDSIPSPSTRLLRPRYPCITDVFRYWIRPILCDFAQYCFVYIFWLRCHLQLQLNGDGGILIIIFSHFDIKSI